MGATPDTDLDALIKALSRVKREADDTPLFATPPQILPSQEGRENLRFVFWMIGGLMTLIGTIIIATTVVVGYRNDTRTNASDIKTLMDRTSIMQIYDFKEIGRLTLDMSTQREYGVSNYDWYTAKHGYPPRINPPPTVPSKPN